MGSATAKMWILLFALCWIGGVLSYNQTGSEPSEYILDFPMTDNPLKIKVAKPYSKNYFMMIGDWGAPSTEGTYKQVQKAVADKMVSYYKAQKAKGMNLLFVAAVGDNFYWNGQDCSTWKADWTAMYGDHLTAVPWLAIKGNHDWYDHMIYIQCIQCILSTLSTF